MNAVAICIVSANRTSALKGLLMSLRQQRSYAAFDVLAFNGTDPKFANCYSTYLRIEKYFPEIKFFHKSGGPALGRAMLLEYCRAQSQYQHVIFLDDDTFPASSNTLVRMLASLKNSNASILAGIWKCEKNPMRAYGSTITIEANKLLLADRRAEGFVQIHIPLATFCLNISKTEALRLDSFLPFYGDLLDLGLQIYRNQIDTFYDSSIVFHHRKIKNDIDPKDYRTLDPWQYLSNKYLLDIEKNGKSYRPLPHFEKQLPSSVQDFNCEMPQYGALDEGICTTLCSYTAKFKHEIHIIELFPFHHETLLCVIESSTAVFSNIYLHLTDCKSARIFCDSLKITAPNVLVFIHTNPDLLLSSLRDRLSASSYIFLNTIGSPSRFQAPNINEALAVVQDSKLRQLVFSIGLPPSQVGFLLHEDFVGTDYYIKMGYRPATIHPWLSRMYDIPRIIPTYDEPVNSQPHLRRFVVPGLIERKRRDYDGIIQAFCDYFIESGDRDFFVDFMGRIPETERDFFKTMSTKVSELQIGACFNISQVLSVQERIGDYEFYSRLNSAAFLVWGIDPSDPKHFPYIFHKSTGTYALHMNSAAVSLVVDTIVASYSLAEDSVLAYGQKRPFKDAIKAALSVEGSQKSRQHYLDVKQNKLLVGDLNSKSIASLFA
jgi:hypothetical protein